MNSEIAALLKARLLSTTSMTKVRTLAKTSSAFARSAYLTERYAYATSAELRAVLTAFFSGVGLVDETSIEELAAQKIHRFHLRECNARLHWITQKPGEDGTGRAARDFFAAQVLFELLAEPLGQAQHYPPVVTEIFERGAEGLFSLGRNQFVMLARTACDLTRWMLERGFKRTTIIEAPLGNTVPTQVLRDIVERRGIGADIVEWGCPRNDRALRGTTVRDSARELARNLKVSDADFVLFMDDALTGTRLLRMARELRKAVGADRLAAVAMRFQFPRGSGIKPFRRKDLSELDGWAREQGLPAGIIEFPALPLFDVDEAGRVFLESALCWGDVDVVAGKRKVNLVFNIIDHYEAIARDLASPQSRYLPLIEGMLWNRDSVGREVHFAPGLTHEVFSSMFVKSVLTSCWIVSVRAPGKPSVRTTSGSASPSVIARRGVGAIG